MYLKHVKSPAGAPLARRSSGAAVQVCLIGSRGIEFSCCGLGSEQGLSGTGITVHSQHVLSRSIRLGAAGLANLLFGTLLGMGLAKSNALTLLRAAAVPRSVHICWQRLSWGRAKHGSHAQNSLERLKRRNASGKSCFVALASDRSRAEKSSFIRGWNRFCVEPCRSWES